MPSSTICVIDDHQDIRSALVKVLQLADYCVTAFASAKDALETQNRNFSGIAISDIRMPNMNGFELLPRLQKLDSDLPILLINGHGDVQMAISAIRSGAYDFIEKPFRRVHLLEVIKRALDKRHLVCENRRLKDVIASQNKESIIGQSVAINSLKEKITRLAKADVNTLIRGKTGTGKELTARRLHEQSDHHKGPLLR